MKAFRWIGVAFTVALFCCAPAWSQAVAVLSVVTLYPGFARVTVAPVAGALDYRIRACDVAGTPADKSVHYFGRVYLKTGAVQLLSTDLAGLSKPGYYEVEAVDGEGTFPERNLLGSRDAALFPSAAAPAGGRYAVPFWCTGPTDDGLISSNGQVIGKPPAVIAVSAPFLITPTSRPVDPSVLWWDAFSGWPATSTVSIDPKHDAAEYTVGTSEGAYDARLNNSDVLSSSLIVNNGLTLIENDGGTPGNSNVAHNGYGALSVSPEQVFAPSPGLSVSYLSTAVTDARRYETIIVTPAGDPCVDPNPETGHTPNASNVFLRVDLEPDCLKTKLGTGFDGTHTATAAYLTGSAGQAVKYAHRRTIGVGVGSFSAVQLNLSPNAIDCSVDADAYSLGASFLAPYASGLAWLSQPVRVYVIDFAYHQANEMDPKVTMSPTAAEYWQGGPLAGHPLYGYEIQITDLCVRTWTGM